MDPFLDGLVGRWLLTGQMGQTELKQEVEARWVLGETFVEMRFSQAEPPYEALYLLGKDPKSGRYVFHLFDSFGVSDEYRFGTGDLDGDRIPFSFLYTSGLFHNTLTHCADGWTWTLEYEADGGRRNFAVKRMVRLETSG